MVTVLNFKDIIDLPKWRPLAVQLTSGVQNIGVISDLRNNEDRHPYIFFMAGSINFFAYNTKSDEFIELPNPALANSFTAGFLMPAQGPRGTIAAGASTTSIPLSTALPAAVGVNQLANRCDGRGFKIRIIGNAGGSSGLTEERLVVANTAGTTPTIVLDSALSFTPIVGDTYEFLSGRVFLLGSSATAGTWKYYDILTNSASGNLSITNLAAITTENQLLGLDELFVPYNRNPGEGFFGNLVATASGAASLTGQAVSGDAGVVINEYRNFQIRIIQDIAIPTAVGQRINITSHTAGPSPVYTVPAWAVTPSANAIYVIENNGDRILVWRFGSTQTSTYTIVGNAWDANVTFVARPVSPGGGSMTHQAFSIVPDPASPSNARHSHIYSFRGGNAVTLDLLDIAGAANGLWTSNIDYGNRSPLFALGSSSTQDPATIEGRYMYINRGTGTSSAGFPTQRFFRFDMKNRVLEAQTFLRIPLYTTDLTVGPKFMAQTVFIDGDTKLSFIFFTASAPAGTSRLFFSLPIIR